jgi:glycerophosphoryl diester phosphodiesterase
MLKAPADSLLPLLKDANPQVLEETLIALAHMPGEVSSGALLPLLTNPDSAVRGATAVALARHHPEIAARAVPLQLQHEMASERLLYSDHDKSRSQHFTPAQIDLIVASFRCQMEMLRALDMTNNGDATHELLSQAFDSKEPFLDPNRRVAEFNLWDRIGTDSVPAVQMLGSSDMEAADRAEWMLVKAGRAALPEVRKALASENMAVRRRAIRIVAWQGDTDSLDILRSMQRMKGPDAETAAWAIVKIENLHPGI